MEIEITKLEKLARAEKQPEERFELYQKLREPNREMDHI